MCVDGSTRSLSQPCRAVPSKASSLLTQLLRQNHTPVPVPEEEAVKG